MRLEVLTECSLATRYSTFTGQLSKSLESLCLLEHFRDESFREARKADIGRPQALANNAWNKAGAAEFRGQGLS